MAARTAFAQRTELLSGSVLVEFSDLFRMREEVVVPVAPDAVITIAGLVFSADFGTRLIDRA